MTEAQWQSCDRPFDMLCHLDGKVADVAFISFSVACCRRLWPLFTNALAQSVIAATEAALSGAIPWDAVSPVYDTWFRAYSNNLVEDLCGGRTNDAVDSVCGAGYGHAALVSRSCMEAVGYVASKHLMVTNEPQEQVTAIWMVAEADERRAQCQLLRQIFGYIPESCEGDSDSSDAIH